jgi:putative transposase
LASQRHLRILSVADVFTRECLALETDTSLGSGRVIRTLEQVIGERGGAPQRIRTDNGPEFTSRCFIAWCLDRRIEPVHIRPGKPVENAHVESFHGRLREECFQVSWFRNLFDAWRQIETWRVHYNADRPHGSLGYRTPMEFAALRAAGLFSAVAGQRISNTDPLPRTPLTPEIRFWKAVVCSNERIRGAGHLDMAAADPQHCGDSLREEVSIGSVQQAYFPDCLHCPRRLYRRD